jgi:hypothetical protein
MSKEQRATTPDLFQVCRRHFSRPVAEVGADLLFWSQCGHNKFRGRAGFFKEDAELVQAIGKHASSIRRALARIFAKVGEDRPEALFEIAHGPKPGQRSGRVRWLFRKPLGDEMIREALLLAKARDEKRQNARTNRSIKPQSVAPDSSDRSAQIERTLYQKNLTESQSDALSSTPERREKTKLEFLKENRKELKIEENDNEELKRFVDHWNAVCTECNEATLAWLQSDIERRATRLVEVIRHLGIPEMPDEELSKRLRLICGKQSRPVFARMGPKFSEYNPRGLVIQTFCNFGPKVWWAVEAELSEGALTSRSLRDLPISPPKKRLTDEEKARELERLTKTWDKACLEQGWPTAVWSRDALDQHSGRLLRFIQATRLHQIPDQELLTRLGKIVDHLASNTLVEKAYLGVFTLQGFARHGEELFRSTLDAGSQFEADDAVSGPGSSEGTKRNT